MGNVSILGVPYAVTYVSDIKDVNSNPRGELVWGQIDYTDRCIRVLDDGCKERVLRTLLHEILHGIIHENNIEELKCDNGCHNEHVIDQLSVGLATALESVGITKIK